MTLLCHGVFLGLFFGWVFSWWLLFTNYGSRADRSISVTSIHGAGPRIGGGSGGAREPCIVYRVSGFRTLQSVYTYSSALNAVYLVLICC